MKGGQLMINKEHLAFKAIHGDKLAFEELLKSESEKLYKIAFLHMQNKEDTLDVIQEATCKAYLSIAQLKEPAYFSTWLVKILIRTAYRELERKKKSIALPEETITYILESNQKEEPTLDLSEPLATLKPEYKNAILLFYYYDLPIRTIANSMGKPPSTIKTYLRRAKLELKRKLGDDYYAQKFT